VSPVTRTGLVGYLDAAERLVDDVNLSSVFGCDIVKVGCVT
jgi:hypothetical protein